MTTEAATVLNPLKVQRTTKTADGSTLTDYREKSDPEDRAPITLRVITKKGQSRVTIYRGRNKIESFPHEFQGLPSLKKVHSLGIERLSN